MEVGRTLVLSPSTYIYCKKCRQYSVEDEKHFLMECPAYQDVRSIARMI
jgi:hypothetical protein